MSVKRPMKPSTRQAISRVGILISPLLLVLPFSAFGVVSLLPSVLVVGLAVFLELSRMRMRMFQFLEFFGFVWFAAVLATVSLHFVLGGSLFVPLSPPVDSQDLLASFRRHEAALDVNFQRPADWASDLPPVGVQLKTLSVVINAHNEQAYLVRTVEGVLSTGGAGLVEIIVLDDGSEPPLLPLVEASGVLAKHLVRDGESSQDRRLPYIHVVRHGKQEGLIRSKIHGASLASGDVVVFLDAHVKPYPDWTTPMFMHMNRNYKRVVAPVIPVLTEDWTVKSAAVGYKMMFDWAFDFNWFDDANWPKSPQVSGELGVDPTLDAVPILSGGLFGISRRWWFESGEYDPKMLNYGAENIEQSLRVWLCGGEITVARDSRIAHLFRPKFPYKVDDRLVMTNKARAVKVWFNDPHADSERTGVDDKPLSQWQEKVVTQGDPNLRGFLALTGDVSERMELRSKCRDFQWFVDRFRQVFEKRGLLDKKGSLLKTVDTSTGVFKCVSALPVEFKGSNAFKVPLVECNEKDPLQNVQLIETDNRVRVKALCLDANAQERDKLNKPVLWYHCDFGKNKNQEWGIGKDGKLKWLNTEYCASELDRELVMTPCESATTFSIQPLL